MFEKKVNSLFGENNSTKNAFVEEALKVTSETTSANGAKKYSTSGDPFIDNFAAISHFKEPRSYEEVDRDMHLLWSVDPNTCLKLAVYIRMITRKSKIVTKKAEVLDNQIGQGLKHEGLMRMIWIAVNQPLTFKRNIPLYIAAASYKDIFKMLSFDLQYNGWDNRKLDWNFLCKVIVAGLQNPETTHLVRKYLPTIRNNKRCSTIEAQASTLIGRWLARRLNSGESDAKRAFKTYRKIKSEGLAHQWQQLISKELYKDINFNTVAGRALSLLVGSKFLENHNLIDSYREWISNKPTAKYTGFVFELFKPLGEWQTTHIEDYKELTINAQFMQLVNKGCSNSGLLVVRDTSGSMSAKALGCNMSAFAIAKSMALYFSYFLKGEFADTYAEFARTCKLHKWVGETPVDKWCNDVRDCVGNTNFQSVIDLFINLKEKGIKEEDFPTGILCVSDGELDPAGVFCNDKTNFQEAIVRLKEVGFSEEYVNNFKIILWDIPNRYYGELEVKFESFADAPNFFYMSGYDPSAINFILDGGEFTPTPKNALELFNKAMDQDLLKRLKVVKKTVKKNIKK